MYFILKNSTRFDAFQVNLTADCNMGCRCSPNELEPVCDTQNKISYYSPCFAGCKSAEGPQHVSCLINIYIHNLSIYLFSHLIFYSIGFLMI